MGTAARGCSVEQSLRARADRGGGSSFCESSNQLEARSAAVGRAPATAVGCPGIRRRDGRTGCTRGGHRFGWQRRSSLMQHRACPGDGGLRLAQRGAPRQRDFHDSAAADRGTSSLFCVDFGGGSQSRWPSLGRRSGRLAAAQVLTYRTDLDGAVTFHLDGQTVRAVLP